MSRFNDATVKAAEALLENHFRETGITLGPGLATRDTVAAVEAFLRHLYPTVNTPEELDELLATVAAGEMSGAMFEDRNEELHMIGLGNIDDLKRHLPAKLVAWGGN